MNIQDSKKSLEEMYLPLPFELSGSTAKNRFRQELTWGIEKIIKLIVSTDDDFVVVFDYVCDIEVHYNDKKKLEFYQIKTQNPPSLFTLNALLKNNNGQDSILGKLFQLTNDKVNKSKDISGFVVSNRVLKDQDNIQHTRESEVSFDNLGQESKKFLRSNLSTIYGIATEIDLSPLRYIHTHFDFENPNVHIAGIIVQELKNYLGREVTKPAALCASLQNYAALKACNEMKFKTYDEILDKKGLSRSKVTQIIEVHNSISSNYAKLSKEWLTEKVSDYSTKIEYLKVLSNILETRDSDQTLNEIIKEIYFYLKENCDSLKGDEKDIANNIQELYNHKLPIGYDINTLFVIAILMLKKIEEENCNYE